MKTLMVRYIVIVAVAAAIVSALPGIASAQPGQGGGPPSGMGQDRRGPGPGPGGRMGMAPPGDEAMGRFFFPPHMVIEAAEEIGLQPEQRAAIEGLMTEAEARFRDNRYQLGNQMTRIASLAVDQPIDEAAILAQLDQVLQLENQIKREQLLMLVRVKNLLTVEQQAELALMRRDPGPPGQRQER